MTCENTNTTDDQLYKYYPLESSQQLVYLIRAIQLGVLWAGPTSGFNDPFDCKPTFRRSTDPVAVKNFFTQLVGKKNKQLSHSEVECRSAKLADGYLSGDSDVLNKVKALEDALLQRLYNGVGVACFAKCHRNVLMWSHYASKHKGACIELPDDREVFREHSLVTVDYESSDRPVLCLPDHDFSEASTVKHLELCYTWKAPPWSYEKERRAIRSSGPGPIYLPNGAVKAVTLGALMEEEHKAVVIQAARTAPHPVAVYQAKLSATKYEVDRELVLP